MYTTKNTINDLLADEMVNAHIDYMLPSEFIHMVPSELRDKEMAELPNLVTMPWGVPYISESIISAANRLHAISESSDYSLIKLWGDNTPKDFFPATDGKQEHVGLLKYNSSFKKGRKMALVVPGGAYMSVAIDNEGMDTADVLTNAGYAVCVLNYRCAPNIYPIPQKDLTLAIKRMRGLAREYDLQDDLLVVGFSAGGHLTASQALYHEEYNTLLLEELKTDYENLYEKYKDYSPKPDKVCLSYAVIDFIKEQHEESFINLTNKDESLRDKLSVDLHVTKDYPKTFVWACDDDELVPPSNSLRMAQALKAAGANVEYRTYPTGGHGCATGVGTSAQNWMNEMIDFMN